MVCSFLQKKRGTPLWRASGLKKNAHFASWRIPQSHLSMSKRETRLHGTTMWENSFYEHQDIQMTTSREFVAARSLSCDRCPTVLCITSLRSHGRLRRENIDRPPVHTEAYRKLSYEIHVTCYSFHLKLRCCSYLQSDTLLNSDWEAQWTRYSYWREAPFIAW